MINRILPAYGGIGHAAWSKYQAAVPPTEGLQRASVPALLLPHVRFRHGPTQDQPQQGYTGRVTVATTWRAEYRLAEGNSRVPVWQTASGKSANKIAQDLKSAYWIWATLTESGKYTLNQNISFVNGLLICNIHRYNVLSCDVSAVIVSEFLSIQQCLCTSLLFLHMNHLWSIFLGSFYALLCSGQHKADHEKKSP